MDKISRQKQRIEILKKKIAKERRNLKVLNIKRKINEKNRHEQKLIKAGRIFEEAGILEYYSHDAALSALQSLKI